MCEHPHGGDDRSIAGAWHHRLVDRHRAVAEEVASEAWSRPDVLAVLLSGSVARREHRPTSDADLILVAAEEPPCPLTRVMRGGLLVEVIEHSESEWRSRFDRPKASWLYSFIEGDVRSGG